MNNRQSKENKTETAADFIKVLIVAVCLCGMLWYAVFCIWGKEYYINYDEYLDIIDLWDSYIFSNILYINKRREN